ncbi:hypothetical protein GCM10020331_095270 [Ectobacillus funiculus]
MGDAATDEIIDAWGEAYGVIAQAFISIEKKKCMMKQNSKKADGQDSEPLLWTKKGNRKHGYHIILSKAARQSTSSCISVWAVY